MKLTWSNLLAIFDAHFLMNEMEAQNATALYSQASRFAHVHSLPVCQLDICTTCHQSQKGTWKLLLKDAQYGGSWESASGYVPLAYGTFDAFKAVWRSGYVSCGSGGDFNNVWQACGGYSFELKRNNTYVVESSGNLPPECAGPLTRTGDIVCFKTLTVAPGDKLTPTWYEPSHKISMHDNVGTITIDLYGYVPDKEVSA
jgi:hypothetical protein